MALVVINGTFINANLKKSEFEGKVSYSVQIDVYQEDSPLTNKVVTIKCDDAEKLQDFQKHFKMGDSFSCTCTLNAYRNQVYYKLIDVHSVESAS